MDETRRLMCIHPMKKGEHLLYTFPGKKTKLWRVVDHDIHGSEFFRIGIVHIAPGEGHGSTHVHENAEQFNYVISGEGVLLGENGHEVGRFKRGHVIFVPEGVPHGFVNDSDETLEMVYVCSKDAVLPVVDDMEPTCEE